MLRAVAASALVAAVGASLFLVDREVALERLQEFIELVKGMESARGGAVFLAAHALAVLVCFPATMVFELAAGFVFGVPRGIALVLAAKLVGGGGGFVVGRKLLRSFVQSKMNAALGEGDSGHGQTFRRIVAGAEKDAWRAVFSLRLSPVPSWLNTYGLAALTSVPVTPFLVATAVGSIPMVVQNVYAGSLICCVADLTVGGGGGISWVSTAVMAVGIASTAYAGKLIMSYAAEEEGKGAAEFSKQKRA